MPHRLWFALGCLLVIAACGSSDEPGAVSSVATNASIPVDTTTPQTTTETSAPIDEGDPVDAVDDEPDAAKRLPDEILGVVVDLTAGGVVVRDGEVVVAGIEGATPRGATAAVVRVPLDGIAPTRAVLPSDAPFVVVADAAAAGATIVVVGRLGVECGTRACSRERGAAWYSGDGGASFAEVDALPFTGQRQVSITGIAAAGPGFVAVGQDVTDGTRIVTATWTSPDGRAWTRGADIAHPQWSIFPSTLAAVDDGLVLLVNQATCGSVNPNGPDGAVSPSGLGRDARVFGSADGLTWERLGGVFDEPEYSCDDVSVDRPDRVGTLFEIDGNVLVVRGDGAAFRGGAAGPMESNGTVPETFDLFDLSDLFVLDDELIRARAVAIEGDVPFVIVRTPAEDETIGASDLIVDRPLEDLSLMRFDRTSEALVVLLGSSLFDEQGVYQGTQTIVAYGT